MTSVVGRGLRRALKSRRRSYDLQRCPAESRRAVGLRCSLLGRGARPAIVLRQGKSDRAPAIAHLDCSSLGRKTQAPLEWSSGRSCAGDWGRLYVPHCCGRASLVFVLGPAQLALFHGGRRWAQVGCASPNYVCLSPAGDLSAHVLPASTGSSAPDQGVPRGGWLMWCLVWQGCGFHQAIVARARLSPTAPTGAAQMGSPSGGPPGLAMQGSKVVFKRGGQS